MPPAVCENEALHNLEKTASDIDSKRVMVYNNR